MTVYEQELRKLFEHSDLVDRPQFSGRVCVGDLGKDLRVRVEFLSTHISCAKKRHKKGKGDENHQQSKI